MPANFLKDFEQNLDSHWVKDNLNFGMSSSSSRSILDSLLIPPSTSSSELMRSQTTECNGEKAHKSTIDVDDEENLYCAEDDVVLIDGIDAVLGHYADSLHRVDMMETWSGSNSQNSNSGKIKKGRKLCASLLRWSRLMQPLPRRHSSGTAGHDRNLNPEVKFVAEVMRLLAARWREVDEANHGKYTRKRRKKEA